MLSIWSSLKFCRSVKRLIMQLFLTCFPGLGTQNCKKSYKTTELDKKCLHSMEAYQV